MKATDRELVDRILDGDAGAWDELVDRYSGLLYAVLRTFSRLSRQDRQDLVQEIFFRLFERGCRALRAWQGRDADVLTPYLAIIAQRTAINFLRKKHIEPEPVDPGSSGPELGTGGSNPASPPSAETLVSIAELTAIVLDVAREVLDDRELEVLTRHAGGETRAEIGAVLGLTANNVGVILHRALVKLQRALSERYPGVFGGGGVPV